MKRHARTSYLAVLTALLLVVVAVVDAQQQQQMFWGQRAHDSQHTHLAPPPSQQSPEKIRTPLWAGPSQSFAVDYANVGGEPLVDNSGVAYFVSEKTSTNLTALDLHTGEIKWMLDLTSRAGSDIALNPQLALSNDGSSIHGVFLTTTTTDKAVFLFGISTQTGNTLWQSKLSDANTDCMSYSLAVHPSGSLLLTDAPGVTLSAFDAKTGNATWTAKLAGTEISGVLVSPAAAQEVIVLTKNQTGLVPFKWTLQALDPTTGNTVWSEGLYGPATAALDAVDGTSAYVSVAAYGETVRETWAYNTDGTGVSYVLYHTRVNALALNGDLFGVTRAVNPATKAQETVVARFNALLQLRWNWTLPAEEDDDRVSPDKLWDNAVFAVDGDDMVYVYLASSAILYGIRASDGKSAWKYGSPSDPLAASVSIGAANNQSLVFFPEVVDKHTEFKLLGCCSGHGVCLSNLTCACTSNYYRDDCSQYCLASDTCQGHGVCNNQGNCSCTDTNFWEFTTYGGDHCDSIVSLTLPAGIAVALAVLAVIGFTAYTMLVERKKRRDDYAPLGSVVSE